MHIVAAFVIGGFAGGFAVALFYRRAAIKLEELKRELEARARTL